MDFNLKWFVHFWVRPNPTLLSLMSKLTLHFTALVTIMGILTSRTIFPNFSIFSTIMTLNMDFAISFAYCNI